MPSPLGGGLFLCYLPTAFDDRGTCLVLLRAPHSLLLGMEWGRAFFFSLRLACIVSRSRTKACEVGAHRASVTLRPLRPLASASSSTGRGQSPGYLRTKALRGKLEAHRCRMFTDEFSPLRMGQAIIKPLVDQQGFEPWCLVVPLRVLLLRRNRPSPCSF